jgi:hypothetical protein
LCTASQPPTFAELFGDQAAVPIAPSRSLPQIYGEHVHDYGFQYRLCYPHTERISSELVRVPTADREQKIAFGDERGNVVIKNWGGVSQSAAASATEDRAQLATAVCPLALAPVVDVQYIKNYGVPMVVAASGDGVCHCARVTVEPATASLSKVISFPIFATPVTGGVRCTVAEGPMILYSYVPNVSADIIRRDLRGDRLLRPLHPKSGVARGIHVIEGYRDCVACITPNHFEFWDLRASFYEPVIAKELEQEVFALRPLDFKRYAIASTVPIACYLDLERPDGVQYRPLFDVDPFEGMATMAFAAQPNVMTALAHTGGITLMNINGTQAALPLTPRIGQERRLNSHALLFHETAKSLAFVHERQFLWTVDIIEKRLEKGGLQTAFRMV